MDGHVSIWIKTSLVEESIASTCSSSSTRRLNRDRFVEDEDNGTFVPDWGWVKGEIMEDERDRNKEENGNENVIRVMITDEESVYKGRLVGNLSSKELVKGTILIANKDKNEPTLSEEEGSCSDASSERMSHTEYPSDLTNLTHLHEPAILHVLRKRYEYDCIYTTASETILVALNPFKYCEDLYSLETMELYYTHGCGEGCGEGLLSPHVFSIADSAYRIMKRRLNDAASPPTSSADQSILVSGESGAGKTVSTKYVMKYLATLSRFESHSRTNSNLEATENKNQVEQQVLQSNPILESFGNARTIRNDNSSRFGKFIELQFQKQTQTQTQTQTTNQIQLVGATIETYLLEKVRLITQSYGERNFHIFYEILSGFSEEQLQEYYLDGLSFEDFRMLSSSETYTRRDGVDDVDTYDSLLHALETMEAFSPGDITDIFTVTSLCLHLSNLDIVPSTNNNNEDGSKISTDNPHLLPTLSLLGVSYEELNEAICYFSILVAGKERHKRSMTPMKADRACKGLVKACYGSLFTFLVQRINSSFIVSKSTSTTLNTPPKPPPRLKSPTTPRKLTKSNAFIGILDIFGFESFDHNSFEQLCINYCNEALQSQFNLFIFQQEQTIYSLEGIDWKFITFPDNGEVLHLLDSKLVHSNANTNVLQHGLFQILDDQCRAPGTSDKSFATELYRKLQQKNTTNSFIADYRQIGLLKFSIQHYAGIVEYDTAGFVDKNKDELPKETTELLDTSTNSFYTVLSSILKMQSNNTAPTSTPSPRTIHRKSSSKSLSSSRTTTGYQFRHQLQNLLSKIQTTTPHYIRCIKPNDLLEPDHFDCKRIVNQLRCAGVVEAIRISRSGYPHRFQKGVFLGFYFLLGGFENNLLCAATKNKKSVTPIVTKTKKNRNSRSTSSSSSSRPLDVLINAIRTLMMEEHDRTQKLNQTQQESTSKHTSTPKTKMDIKNCIQVGKTKVFCNTQAYEFIERKRKQIIQTSILKIQSISRMFIARQYCKQLRETIRLERESCIVIQCRWRRYSAWSSYQNTRMVILFCQKMLRAKKARDLFTYLLLHKRTIQLQTNIRMLLCLNTFTKQKHASIQIQCIFRSYKAKTLLKQLKEDAQNFQKILLERNLLQKEKLDLLKDLKEARELLLSLQPPPSLPQSQINQTTPKVNTHNLSSIHEDAVAIPIEPDVEKKSLPQPQPQPPLDNEEDEIAEIESYCLNILNSDVLAENEKLKHDITEYENNNKQMNNQCCKECKVQENNKEVNDTLKHNLLQSQVYQDKLHEDIRILKEQHASSEENGGVDSNNATIMNLQEEIRILKEKADLDSRQLETLALKECTTALCCSNCLVEQDINNTLCPNNITNYNDDSDDDSSGCASDEERIQAARSLFHNSDESSSKFFLEKEAFIPPDTLTFLNDDIDGTTTASQNHHLMHKFNNDELSQYDDLSLQHIDNESTYHNQLQQTTKYSDLKSSMHLPSGRESETSSASCITALTTQLDMANYKIVELKSKLKLLNKNQNQDAANNEYNLISKQDLFSHTASSTTSSASGNNNVTAYNDDDISEIIKSDVPRNIEVEVSSKCERLEQQLVHLERRLDNMSMMSSSRRSRTSSKHSYCTSTVDDDITNEQRERNMTRSTVVDDISFSVPGSINNEQVIHQLLSDNDFIRTAVRNHMEEFTRSGHHDTYNHQQHQQMGRQQEHQPSQHNNIAAAVTYPAMSCPIGSYFRSFMKSSSANDPSSSQSAYSSAYHMR